MQAWIDFFTTDYGLMSLIGLLIVLAIGSYFGWYVSKHIKEDTERHDRLVREARKG
jgi:hypothetical protein